MDGDKWTLSETSPTVPFMNRESDLYPPIKALLERQGYTVKGEVGAADLVAVRDDAPPVIVELKLRFSLSLFHQAVARLAITDQVYLAVPKTTWPCVAVWGLA